MTNTKTNIKVGDIVKVTDWGETYPTYCDFFDEMRDEILKCDKLTLSDIARYGKSINDINDSDSYSDALRNCDYEVILIGTHHYSGHKIAIIKQYEVIGMFYGDDDCHIYIIDVNALSTKVKNMTIKEIEELLGYKINLVP